MALQAQAPELAQLKALQVLTQQAVAVRPGSPAVQVALRPAEALALIAEQAQLALRQEPELQQWAAVPVRAQLLARELAARVQVG